MSSLNPPLTKEDFINSGCKEVVNSSSQDCFSYSLAFFSKLQNAKQTGNIKNQAVFQILVDVSSDEIEPSATKKSFPEIFQHLTDEHLNFLAEILDEVSDPELKARIADILWLRLGNIDMAKKAIDAYLEITIDLENPIMLFRLAKIERALRLGLSINANDKVKKIVARIEAIINDSNGKDPWGVSTNLMELLQEKKLQERQLFDPIKYAVIAEEWAKQAELDHDWHGARRYWGITAEWHHIGKNVEKAHTARMYTAETYRKEAEDSLNKHPTSYFKASQDLKKAFEAFERLKSQCEEKGEINTKLEEIHKRLLEYQQKSSNELIVISSELNLSQKEMEVVISNVKGKEFLEAISGLARFVIPRQVSVSSQTVEENGLSGLFPEGKINEMGKVVAHQSSNNQEEAARYQKIYALAFIEPARKQIISEHIIQKSEDHKIKESYLLPLVSNNPFVPSGREHLFVKGLYAGLIGDFITSTHILIPQIENSVRYLLSNRGAITSGIDNKNNGIQQENNLNTTLFPSKYPQITSIFDEDTLFELQGLLIEKSGSNLRNRMAHGLINDNEFFSPIFSYLWWVTLRLCFGLGIEIPQEIVEESNPLVKFAGMFKHDPFFDEFVEEIAINRRKLDEEMVTEEASIEENHAA
jgi:hypothetical protein